MSTVTEIKQRKGAITEDQYKKLERLFDNCPDDCDICTKSNYCTQLFCHLCDLRRAVFMFQKPKSYDWLKRGLINLFGVKEADLCL